MDKFILLSMYIRIVRQKNKKTGEVYATHRLVEAYRNTQGKVRQQVLLNLGCHFPVPQKDWKLLADELKKFSTSIDVIRIGILTGKRSASHC